MSSTTPRGGRWKPDPRRPTWTACLPPRRRSRTGRPATTPRFPEHHERRQAMTTEAPEPQDTEQTGHVEEIDVADVPEPDKPDEGAMDSRDTYTEGDGAE